VNAALKSPESSTVVPNDPNRRSYFEVTQFDIDGDIAFWTGFQHITTQSPESGEPVVTSLRITEVLRRADDEWALVLRHADPVFQ
jgi:ketosteroid isomerase-like protein